MSIGLIMPDRDVSQLVAALGGLLPEVAVQSYPDIRQPDTVRLAVLWRQPPGSVAALPGLAALMSYGAGVEDILEDPTVPSSLPVGRVVDPGLVEQMCSYLLAAVLQRARGLAHYRELQEQRRWQPELQPVNPTIGVLGLGQIGLAVARSFRRLGCPVAGWSRGPKQDAELTCLHGQDGLRRLAERSEYLICLLPLTAETRGILNADLFARARRDCYLINVGRGQHLVESDLLEALDAGVIAGACLDVFQQEPLPPEHPFWHHERIRITPHVAAVTCPEAAAHQIAACYVQICAGSAPLNRVDRERGY